MITDQNFDQIATFGRIAIVEENLSALLTDYEPGRPVVLYVFFTAANSDEKDMVFDQTKISSAISAGYMKLVNYLTGAPYTLGSNPQDAASQFRVTRVFNKDVVNVVEVTSGSFEGRAAIAVSFTTTATPSPVSTEFMSFSGFDSWALIRKKRA